MENNDCLFCKIIKGEIPSTKVYENEYVLAFNDINPATKIHVIIIPKVHIDDMNKIDDKNIKYVSEIFNSIKEVAKACGVFETGYRIISNCGKDARPGIKHLHFHLLGGQDLGEKII